MGCCQSSLKNTSRTGTAQQSPQTPVTGISVVEETEPLDLRALQKALKKVEKQNKKLNKKLNKPAKTYRRVRMFRRERLSPEPKPDQCPIILHREVVPRACERRQRRPEYDKPPFHIMAYTDVLKPAGIYAPSGAFGNKTDPLN